MLARSSKVGTEERRAESAGFVNAHIYRYVSLYYMSTLLPNASSCSHIMHSNPTDALKYMA